MDLRSLPVGLQSVVAEELDNGEQVLWAGRPAMSRFVLRALPVAFFGIFFAGFAAFWMATAFTITGKHREMEQRHADFDREWNENRAQMQRDPWGNAEPAPKPAPPPRPAAEADSGFSFRDLFPLFGLIFLIVGLGMIASPLWAGYKAANTVYVVTDRRAIIFNGGWSTHIRSFGPSELGSIERRQRGNGSGDIILAKEPYYVSGHYSGTPGRGGHHVPGYWTTQEIGFFGIAGVKHVDQLLRGLANRATP